MNTASRTFDTNHGALPASASVCHTGHMISCVVAVLFVMHSGASGDMTPTFVTVNRDAHANTREAGSRIRCIRPAGEGRLFLAASLARVRIPTAYRTTVSFTAELSPATESGHAVAPCSIRHAPADIMERFVPLRTPDTRVSMRDEMVAATDFDNGRIRAMAVRDRTDRMRIRGFVRIPTVWGMRFEPPDALKRAPIMLAEAVNRYTDMEASMDGHLMLTDRRLFSTPFLYITTTGGFESTQQENEGLVAYLRSGGFAFLEDGEISYRHGPGGTSLKKMLCDALGSHARFEPIPLNHPLYHCLFDFSDGPPLGDENRIFTTSMNAGNSCGMGAQNAALRKPSFFLEGIFLDGQLVAVFSEKSYGTKWAQSPGSSNNEPQMRFAANLVVYALTREGGMTDHIMEGFADVW